MSIKVGDRIVHPKDGRICRANEVIDRNRDEQVAVRYSAWKPDGTKDRGDNHWMFASTWRAGTPVND